ncbi:MAG: hypothetical protein Q9191_000209 [Dirinaria sp. TL-2023a]
MLNPNTFQTPPLRVSRPISACSRCRTAKIKCDGKLPACSACERSGKADECSSTNEEFARGKERNYVSSLETRLEKLERQLEEARGRRTSLNVLDTRPTQTAGAHTGTERPTNQGKESSHMDDLVSDFGFLSVNATARDFHGFTKEMSFAKLALSTSVLEPLPQPTRSALPPRYVLTPLIQYYVDNVLVLYPFLSETVIFASLAEHEGQNYASPVAHWTVRMVVAISLASLSKKRGDQYYQDATWVFTKIFPWIHRIPNLILLRAGVSTIAPTYLIGTIDQVEIRMDEAELISRRAISMVHRRAFSFTDDSANVDSEISFNEGTLTHTVIPAQQLLRLRQLQSSTYQQLYWSSAQSTGNEWTTLSASLTEMHSWAVNLSASITPIMRALFLSELLYGYIIMVSAPNALDSSKAYAGAIILDSAARYADQMYYVTQNFEEAVLYTSHDVLRACYVGERLMDVVEQRNPYVFGTVPPKHPDISSSGPPLAQIRPKTLEDALKRTTKCIVRLDSVLEYLCGQYEYPELLAAFRLRSAGPLQQLCAHNAIAE